MRIRLLSSYPLILGPDGRPVLPNEVVEIVDDFALSLCLSDLAEEAPDADVTVEATVTGWRDEPEADPEAPAEDPQPSSDEPSPRRRARS